MVAYAGGGSLGRPMTGCPIAMPTLRCQIWPIEACKSLAPMHFKQKIKYF